MRRRDAIHDVAGATFVADGLVQCFLNGPVRQNLMSVPGDAHLKLESADSCCVRKLLVVRMRDSAASSAVNWAR